MNGSLINIKVDREERLDVDGIYMRAMTGHGGWPMTMFLMPDESPFYGGTYFPPDDMGTQLTVKRLPQQSLLLMIGNHEDSGNRG